MSGSTRAPSALWPIDFGLKQRALKKGFLIEKPAPFQGRFSNVFLGYAELNTARVIVKVTQRDRAKAEEENLLTFMDHPISGIPTLYGSWYDDQTGKGVIVTGLKEGIPLTQLFKDRVLPPREERIRIVKEVARFLKHAHEFGLFHGDIHMGQIVWDAFTNEVALVDWAGITSCHESFSAPEDRANNPYHKNWGPWTDVYRFGRLVQIMWPEKANLFAPCLRKHPRQRWTMDQVVERILITEKEIANSQRILNKTKKHVRMWTATSLILALILVVISTFFINGEHRKILKAVKNTNVQDLRGFLLDPNFDRFRDEIIKEISTLSDYQLVIKNPTKFLDNPGSGIRGINVSRDPTVWFEDGILKIGQHIKIGDEVGYFRDLTPRGMEIKTPERSLFLFWPKLQILDQEVPITVNDNYEVLILKRTSISELGELAGEKIESSVQVSGFFSQKSFSAVVKDLKDQKFPVIGYKGLFIGVRGTPADLLEKFSGQFEKKLTLKLHSDQVYFVRNPQFEDLVQKLNLKIRETPDEIIVEE